MDNVLHLPTTQQTTNRFELVQLGRRGPRKNINVLVPGLLLKGQTHLFYGATETGKSWIAMYAAREVMKECLPVIYLDLENLEDVTEERMLDALAVPQDDVDDYLRYGPGIDLTLDRESKGWFTSLLDSLPEPGLIIWDSLLGFLTRCGLKEDDSGDFEQWASVYLEQARYRGWTSMLLDHTGHSGEHPRGSSRKSQAVQVVWKVENGKKDTFNREKVGRQKLSLEKDRLAYLPDIVTVTLGGTPFTFETRYEGQEFLATCQHSALRQLDIAFDGFAISKSGWKDVCVPNHMSNAQFYRVVNELNEKRYVSETGGLFKLTPEGKKKVS